MIRGSGGSKSRLAKTRVRSHVVRWEMKSCTLLRPEAHLQVKQLKTPHVRTTFGSWAEKVHTVVARSIFASEKAQNNLLSERFWKLTCRKSARRCGRKHICKWNSSKHLTLGARLEVDMSKKRTTLRREAHLQLKKLKSTHVRNTFGRSNVVLCGRRKGLCTLSKKWVRREGFTAVSKALAGVGHLKRICKEAFRVAGAVQETCPSEMSGGQGADFLKGLHFGASNL